METRNVKNIELTRAEYEELFLKTYAHDRIVSLVLEKDYVPNEVIEALLVPGETIDTLKDQRAEFVDMITYTCLLIKSYAHDKVAEYIRRRKSDGEFISISSIELLLATGKKSARVKKCETEAKAAEEARLRALVESTATENKEVTETESEAA